MFKNFFGIISVNTEKKRLRTEYSDLKRREKGIFLKKGHGKEGVFKL